MRKYIAAIWLIAVATVPASAIDLDFQGSSGGVGVNTSVGAGSQGGSAGVGAKAGGVADVDAGASVGTKGGSAKVGGTIGGAAELDAGASIGTKGGSAKVGGTIGGAAELDAGASIGTKGGSTGASGGAAAGVGAGGAPSRGGPAPVAAAKGSVKASNSARSSLPCVLQPSGCGGDSAMRNTLGYSGQSAAPGTPMAVVRACRDAISSAAAPLGAVRVEAASAGPLSRDERGALAAPIRVRIDYAGAGGIEVRQAKVRCRLDTTGRVIAVM